MHCSAPDTLSASSGHVVLLFIYCEPFTVCLDTSCSSTGSGTDRVHFLHRSKVTSLYICIFCAIFGICNFVQVT